MPYRDTPKTRARKRARRDQLLEAARSLVAEGGFAAASVQAVANRAGIATGSVYRHFPSKADLFVEVFATASAHEVERMRLASRDQPSASASLRAAVTTWATRALEGRTLAYALIAEPVMPEVEAARLRFRRAYVELLRGILLEGCHAGEFALPSVDVAAAAIVGALAEALVGPLSPMSMSGPAERHALVNHLVHFCQRAVTPSTPS